MLFRFDSMFYHGLLTAPVRNVARVHSGDELCAVENSRIHDKVGVLTLSFLGSCDETKVMKGQMEKEIALLCPESVVSYSDAKSGMQLQSRKGRGGKVSDQATKVKTPDELDDESLV